MRAVRITPGQAPRPIFPSSGRVLGLMPADDFRSETLDLATGETFVLFTDGVSEAFDANEDLFGEERLLAQLQASPGRSARETTLGVLEAVRRYAAGAPQSDDITVVSILLRRATGTACRDASRRSVAALTEIVGRRGRAAGSNVLETARRMGPDGCVCGDSRDRGDVRRAVVAFSDHSVAVDGLFLRGCDPHIPL